MKKSVRKVSKKKTYNNRLLYSLIALGILIVVAVGVYALTPGVAPANGHVITSIAPPSGCGSNTYLKWTGSAWSCATPTVSESDPVFTNWYNAGNPSLTSLYLGAVDITNGVGIAFTYSGIVNAGSSCTSLLVTRSCKYTTSGSNPITYDTICVCLVRDGQSSGLWSPMAT